MEHSWSRPLRIFSQVIEELERETWIEPAKCHLGKVHVDCKYNTGDFLIRGFFGVCALTSSCSPAVAQRRACVAVMPGQASIINRQHETMALTFSSIPHIERPASIRREGTVS